MIFPAAGAGVLVVDDEPEVAGYIAEVLAEAGYRCRLADTSATALAAVADRDWSPGVAVAIIDLVLGDANGLAIAKDLVAHDPSLRIVLISGYADHVVSNPLPNGRSAAFLTKPFTAVQLLEAVRAISAADR